MLKKRVALLMAMIMAFTSVDSSILMVSAAEVTEHVHVEETDVQEVFDITEEIPAEEVQEEIVVEEAETEAMEEVVSEVVEEVVEEEVVIDNTLELEETIDEVEIVEVLEDVSNVTDAIPMSLNVMHEATLTDETQAVWFSFVPEETGRYTFTSYCSEGMYNMNGTLYLSDTELRWEGWNAAPNSNNFSLSYKLEAGNTYYLSVNHDYCPNGDFSLQVVKQREIASFDLVSAPELTFVSNIDYVLLRDVQMKINYADGASEDFTIMSDCSYDAYGNGLVWEIYRKVEGGELEYTGYSNGCNLLPGNYIARICHKDRGEAGVCDSSVDVPFTVIELEDSSYCYGNLYEGFQEVQSFSEQYAYYVFTPEKSGTYKIENWENNVIRTKDEWGWNQVRTYDADNFYFEAGVMYYIGFKAYEGQKRFELNLFSVPEIASVEVIPGKTEIIADWENYYMGDLRLKVTYEDDSVAPQTLAFTTGSSTWDSFGNTFYYHIIREEQYYSEWQCLEEGEYQVCISGSGIEGEQSYTLTAKPVSEMVTDTLSEGTLKIPVSADLTFYKWNAGKGKRFTFVCSDSREWEDRIVLQFYPIDEAGTVLDNFSYELYDYNERLTLFTQYDQYYVGIKTSGVEGEAALTIKEQPAIASLEAMVSEPITFIENVDKAYPYNANIRLKIVYNDGHSEEIRFNEWYEDDYGNGIGYNRYEKMEDGSYEWVSTYPEIGSYVFHISVSDEVYVDVPFTVIPMSSASQGDLSSGGSQDVTAQGGELFYRFTPETSGCYRFTMNVAAKSIKILDDAGTNYAFTGEDGEKYDRYARLEAGTEYFVKANVGRLYAKAKLEVHKVKVITEMTTTAIKKEYLAGFESFDGGRTKTKIVFDDGSAFTATNYDRLEDVRLTYRVEKDGEAGDWSERTLREGTYTVTPELTMMTSGSAILISGSAVTAAVTTDTIRAVRLDPSTLQTVEKDNWVELSENGATKYFAFTAAEAGEYQLERQIVEGLYSATSFYKLEESGWEYAGLQILLNEGETCVISAVCYGGQFRVVSEVEEPDTETPDTEEPIEEDFVLRVNEPKSVEITEGESVAYTFTPEESGYYKFISYEEDHDPYVNLYCEDNWVADSDDEGPGLNFQLICKMDAGKTYTYHCSSYSKFDNYEVLLTKVEPKAISTVEIIQKKSYEYFDYAEDVFEVKVTYEDQTVVILPWYTSTDDYLNDFEYLEKNVTDSEEYNRVLQVSYFELDGKEGKVSLNVRQGEKTDLPELVPGEETSFSTAEGRKYYQFTPSKDAEYVFRVYHTEACDIWPVVYDEKSWEDFESIETHYVAISDNEEYTDRAVNLEAGEFYWIKMDYDNWSEADQTVRFGFYELSNVIEDVEVAEQPTDLTFYRWNSGFNFNGLKVKVTYTDGTSEIVAYGDKDSQGRGFTSYGSEYWIGENVKRVYLSFDEHRVYVDFTAVEADALPLLEEGKSNTLDVAPGTWKNVRFIPKETGTYAMNLTSGTTNGSLLWCVEDHAYAGRLDSSGCCELEAGKTYVMRVLADNGQIVIAPMLKDACIHTFDDGKVTKEANCAEEGEMTYTCTKCGASRTETIPTDADNHVYSEETVISKATCTADGMIELGCKHCDAVQRFVVKATGHTQSEDVVVEAEATCTADGRQSYTCTVCKESLKSEPIPALGHQFGTEYKTDKEASCSEEGSESIHCTVCNAINADSVRNIEKTAHQWSDWTTVKEATCITEGSRQRSCQICHEEETEAIPVTGEHVYSEKFVEEKAATCTEDGTSYKACMTPGCNSKIVEVLPALGHDAAADHMKHEKKEETDTEAGKEYDFCTICEKAFHEITIPSTQQQTILDETYQTVSKEDWTPTEETLNSIVTSVASVDNNAMMDGTPKKEDGTAAEESGMDVVTMVENKLINATVGEVTIGETKVTDEKGNANDTFNIEGAAFTAAAAQLQTQMASMMLLYDNGIAAIADVINSVVKSVVVVDENSIKEADGKLNYQFTMSLYLEKDGEKEENPQEILAPVRVTVTIPEAYRDMNFTVYRLVNGERKAVSSAVINRGENRVTFETPALGTFGFTDISCMDHSDAVMVEDETRSKAASCAATGLASTVCEKCHNYWSDVTLSTVDHELEETVITEATCAEAGEKEMKCKNCTYAVTTEIPASGQHTWTEWTVTAPETCKEDGEETRTCAHCKETQKRVLNKINGHVYAEEFTTDVPASCEKKGEESRHCIFECGEKVEVRTIPAEGHDWDEGVITKKATCVSDGEITYTCQRTECGVTRTEAQNALEEGVVAHSWNTEKTVDKEPSCTEEGSKSIHCSNCDETKDAESIEKLAHSYKEVIKKAATCGATGSRYNKCTVCGEETALEIIPATGKHSYSTVVDKSATCGAAGSKHDECTVCHDKKAAVTVPATGRHNFASSTWTVTKEATAVAEGTKERICSVCKTAKETGKVDKLKATYELNTKGSKVLPLQLKKSVTIKVTGLAKGDKVVSFSSSDTKIATVSNSGVVKASKKKTGTVTITIKLLSGTSITQQVKVQKAKVKTSSIIGVSKNVTVKQGKTLKLTPSMLPITTADTKIKYSTSNKKVATVTSKGVVKGIKGGTAKITIKSGSKKFVCTVKVEPVKTTSIKLNKTAVSLKKKKSTTLKVTRTPKASTETIKFTSSNKKVATVNSKGKITAKKAGTAVITVTCGSTKATCTVTVK